MTNITVSRSMVIFRDGPADTDEGLEIRGEDYLRAREMAERAAAKNSPTQAGRRVHQELAQLYGLRRRAQPDA